jgi:hypothetical protein
MLSVVMSYKFSVIMLNVVKLSIVMLNVVMLNVIKLSVIMLNVVASMNVPKYKHFNGIKFFLFPLHHCKKAILSLESIS